MNDHELFGKTGSASGGSDCIRDRCKRTAKIFDNNILTENPVSITVLNQVSVDSHCPTAGVISLQQ
jgi:hypothetical protein